MEKVIVFLPGIKQGQLTMRNAINIIKNAPGILHLRKKKYDRLFAAKTDWNLFSGVYSSFSEATSNIPNTKPIGYDHTSAAKMYTNIMNKVRLVDYPIIFWLDQLINNNSVVFDYGGHIGIKFYSISKYIKFPKDLQWKVYDLPAVIEEGKKIAEQEGEKKLFFTNDMNCIAKSNIFLASGSLQYFEEPLYATLNKISTQPQHVLINGLPLHEKHEFITINNMGTAYCPYKIHKKDTFIDGMNCSGWKLLDLWENTARDKTCHIPFHESHNGSKYYGMYFTKKNREKDYA